MTVLGFALAALIGISLGLLGGGGSILTVPILVYVLGFEPKPAIAMSLIVVGTAAFVGALRHQRLGNLRARTAFAFGALAMVGAYVGARLAVLLSGATQLVLLGIAMLAAAASMYRSAGWEPETEQVVHEPRFADLRLGAIAATGLGVGLLTGIAGVGGGFLIVPALVLFAAVPIKQAVGTSLLVIAMNSAAGFAGYVGHVEIPWVFLAGFTMVAILGIGIGTSLVRYVSAAALKRAFAVFLVVMGVFILYRNRAVFR